MRVTKFNLVTSVYQALLDDFTHEAELLGGYDQVEHGNELKKQYLNRFLKPGRFKMTNFTEPACRCVTPSGLIYKTLYISCIQLRNS